TRVWRYMDGWKFERLLNDKALFFCRADRLEDEMEGKYAEANQHYTTRLWSRFTSASKIQDDRQMREEQALLLPHFTFVNCWHINRVESSRMWKECCKTKDSLVVVSTVRQIKKLVQKRNGFAVGRVRYERQTVVRPEWSNFAPFFFKDPLFYQEREYRLI